MTSETYQPALERLTQDCRECLTDLLDGFDDTKAPLRWAQRVAVRTHGYTDQRLFRLLGRQYISPECDQDRALLAALLTDRDADLSDAAAKATRQRLAAKFVAPAMHQALRELRTDAGEYFGDATDSAHDPATQRYIGMRPMLTEIDGRQQDALEALLAGFDGLDDVLTWAGDLELATYGELRKDWVASWAGEHSTLATLTTTDSDLAADGRQLIAARVLLPAYNRGVRELAGRAGEQPHEAEKERTRTQA